MIKAKIIIFDDETGEELASKTVGDGFYIDRQVDYPEVSVKDYVFMIRGGSMLGHTSIWKKNPIFGEIHYITQK